MLSVSRTLKTHGNTAGKYGSRLYWVWAGMRSRCNYSKHIVYKHYGGRGITVCAEWSTFTPFEAWALKNGWKPDSKVTIDRIDTNGNYSPENCRIVSYQINANNKKNTKFVTAWGERKSAFQWAQDSRCVVSHKLLAERINNGILPEIAISQKHFEGRLILAFNERKTLREWSKDARCVVDYHRLRYRINQYNWEPEMALTTPTIEKHKRRTR